MSENALSTGISQKAVEANEKFQSRSMRFLEKLEGMMDGVTGKQCTPETVNAACNCADKAIQIMRLNFEAHRFAAEHGALDPTSRGRKQR